MELKRSGSQSSAKGPAEYFTGNVRIDPLFQAADPSVFQPAWLPSSPGPAQPGIPIRWASAHRTVKRL